MGRHCTFFASVGIALIAGCDDSVQSFALDLGSDDGAPALDVANSDAAPIALPAPVEALGPYSDGGADPLGEPSALVPLAYVDETGAERTFGIAVYLPADVDGLAPVVVWSHGGSHGVDRPEHVGHEWGAVFVDAGYAFVAVAHPLRADRGALCAALDLDTTGEACATINLLGWDRPRDFRVVADWLDANGASLGIDAAHLMYGGHSAGAGSVLTAAGARRDWGAPALTAVEDPRPEAFLAASPPGIGESGFVEASFPTIDRPVLVLTGDGDDIGNTLSEARRAGWDAMDGPAATLGWLADPTARHLTFDHDASTCEDERSSLGLDPERCTAFVTWLESPAIAFADAHLRGSADAADWLAGEGFVATTGGAGWLERK